MFLKHLWPALLCALAVLILCVTPTQDLPQLGVINFDKAIHLIMFGGLTLLFAKGFYKQPTYELLNRHYLTAAFLFCTLYGGFLEILQATDWINRSGDWLDFLFNALGALAAIGILKLQKDLLLR